MARTKLDFAIIAKSAIILIAMIYPLSYAHEFGHAIVCASEGFDFDITVDALGGRMVCLGDVSNDVMFRMMGGVLAMITAILPLIKWDWCKRHPYILIPCAVLGIGHGLNAILETVTYEIYFSSHVLLTSFMGFFEFVIFFLFMIKFAKKKPLQNWSTP